MRISDWSSDVCSSDLHPLEAERRIKGWSRAKKEALIREDWTAIHRLASRAKVLRDGTEPSPGSASAPPQAERKFSTAPQASRRGRPEESRLRTESVQARRYRMAASNIKTYK